MGLLTQILSGLAVGDQVVVTLPVARTANATTATGGGQAPQNLPAGFLRARDGVAP